MAAVTCLGLLYASFAYFDDTEASTINIFQAGTWSVGGSGSHTFSNLIAGNSGTETWTATNTGTVSAYVDLNISVTEGGTGDLGDFLSVHLYVSGGANIYGPGAISGIGGGYNLNLPLEPDESIVIILDWSVEDGYFPDENDEIVLTISFNIQPVP